MKLRLMRRQHSRVAYSLDHFSSSHALPRCLTATPYFGLHHAWTDLGMVPRSCQRRESEKMVVVALEVGVVVHFDAHLAIAKIRMQVVTL